jgi:ABC-type bacteriocin/lantibiotic exporter with double-glycine peptidase domain
MPVVLLAIHARWLYQLLVWFVHRSPIRTPVSANSQGYALPPSLMGFIIQYSGNAQIGLALLALLTLPITYIQLELPKLIINGAISSDTLDIANWKASQQVDNVSYLLLLCAIFLFFLMTSSVIKYSLNRKIGIISERLLRRIRLIVIRRRNPTSKGNFSSIPVITQEVEPVCSFSGDAVIVPLLHGGTVVTIVTFMMVQNILLGAAAIALLPIQLIVIPKFQKKINGFVKIRVQLIRNLSKEVQAQNQLRDRGLLRGHIKDLHAIRLKLYRVKFFMKSLNNFIMNLTPFFFYTIGGYLVLDQNLSLGALVASLASYKDLAPAMRELFNYYQRNQDAKLRYFEVRQFLLATE